MELKSGDTILLCSDGVWEPLTEEEMLALLAEDSPSLDATAEDLVRATLGKGGVDNATVVLVRLTS
jgi:protein phosphatase